MPDSSQVIKWHLNSGQFVCYSNGGLNKRPFNDRTGPHDLNTGLVWYSDPHCMNIHSRMAQSVKHFQNKRYEVSKEHLCLAWKKDELCTFQTCRNKFLTLSYGKHWLVILRELYFRSQLQK